MIQELLTKQSQQNKQLNSYFKNDKNGEQFMVQNFQALIDNSYSTFSDQRLKNVGKKFVKTADRIHLHMDQTKHIT